MLIGTSKGVCISAAVVDELTGASLWNIYQVDGGCGLRRLVWSSQHWCERHRQERTYMKGAALQDPLNWTKKPSSPAKAQMENLKIERVLE